MARLIILLLAASLTLAASGSQFFTVGKDQTGRWRFVTPQGAPFWSFGVDCVDPGQSWEDFDPAKPQYRAYSLFPGARDWTSSTLDSLRSWGVNTLGGWADYKLINKLGGEKRLPYTVVLHLGAYCRAPWDDLFLKSSLEAIDKAAKDQILPIKDDPLLIGYFTDNELGWWDDTLFLNYLVKLPASSPGRVRAHQELQKHYKSSFSAFSSDWITSAKNWSQLAKKPELHLRPGGRGMQAVNHWMSVVGDHYYRTVKEAIRKYDKRHLILGDRYCQYYTIPLVKASAKYIDAVSTNLGAHWTDGTNSPYFLETLHRITGKPIVITEFYMAAMENESGNTNSRQIFPTVQTQEQRAAAFKRNVNDLGRIPYVIGAHWFQYTDEPTHGRDDGEDYNMGLIDIHGKPYPLMVEACKSFDLKSFLQASKPEGFDGQVPLAVEPLADPSLLSWPRKEGRVPPVGEAFSDLFVCRDDEALYLGINPMNYMDQTLYQGGMIPESERPLWKVTIGSKSFRVRFSGFDKNKKSLPAKLEGEGARMAEKPEMRHHLVLRIPFSKLNIPADGNIRVQSECWTHSRGEVTRWQTTLKGLNKK